MLNAPFPPEAPCEVRGGIVEGVGAEKGDRPAKAYRQSIEVMRGISYQLNTRISRGGLTAGLRVDRPPTPRLKRETVRPGRK